MSPIRVLRGLIFGAIGGVLGWLLIEFLPLGPPFRPALYEGMRNVLTTPEEQAWLGATLGASIGLLLGISEGLAEGTISRFRRNVLWFWILGAAGGYVGLYFGQHLFSMMHGKVRLEEITPAEFPLQLMARSFSWMLIGLFLGVMFGAPNLSFQRARNGAIGGAIGGLLGGFVFQVLAFTGQFQGPNLRLLGFTVIGACIGFFISLISEAMKRVWVQVLVGRNEGREHVLDVPLAYVGRDELADVPVFLDPTVPKRMASFRMNGGRYGLFAEATAPPVYVNGQPLAQGQVLRDGDAIQFGRVTLAYNEKATVTGRARPVDNIGLADFGTPSVIPGATPIPMGGNVCEFCGMQRDPMTGGCACSVGADAGYGGTPPQPAYAGGYDTAAYPGSMDYGNGMAAAPGYADPGYGATVMDPAGGYAPAAAGPLLFGIEGPFTGQAVPLMSEQVAIGRDPSQDLPLVGDSTASRRHAVLYYTNGSWVLRDEGSSNGTWVNGVRIQEQPLFPGDEVRIGHSRFRFDA
jgi:pSer/pThr/pTyr-binding forkhead associated (FHA) protein